MLPPMPDRAVLPTGIVTFLFTDLEASTRLLQSLGEAYSTVLEEHARQVRAELEAHAGVEVSTGGDSFFAAFPSPTDAVAAAVAVQRSLADAVVPDGIRLKVRMGLHTGRGERGGDDYAGLDVHRAARIGAAAHGGQVLISDATRVLVERALPPDVSLRELGTFRLKDLDTSERLFQLVIDGLPSEFPPIRTAQAGNLTPAATTFVGRGGDIEAITSMMQRARIVTLTGPGGTGKTRLGLEVGRSVGDSFPDGVWFVALDAIRDPELLASAIAATLELHQTDDDVVGTLEAYFHDKRMLLILDNFEQILAAAPLVDTLAAAGPRVRILVTSRAPLRLYGEQEFPVPPLRSPDVAHLPPAAQLGQYEAVALFIARARATQPDFEVTDENAPAVAELCARLDGLPLALELAAARVKLLPPQAILRRFTISLDVLASGLVNLPIRQRTLRSAIAWSYDLLDEPAQRLLDRLGVFGGGSRLEAAERVCNPDSELGIDLLDGLGLLVDNSLVRQRETAGEPRFTLLETIREFAVERLDARGEADTMAERHLGWVLELAEGAADHLSFEDDTAYAMITEEYDNVRIALGQAIANSAHESALRICAAMWRYWQRHGLMEEGRWWTDQALALPGATARTAVRAAGLAASGSLAYWSGDAQRTASAYQESLDIYREVGDESGIATGVFNLAFSAVTANDIPRARALLSESVERLSAMGDRHRIAEATSALGYLEMMAGNLEAADPLIREALTMTDPDSVRRGDAWTMVAHLERRRRDWPKAREAIRAAFEVLARARDETLRTGLVELRGLVEIDSGNPEFGLRLYGAAQPMRQRLGGGPPLIMLMASDTLDAARRSLGAAQVDRLLNEGASIPEDEAISIAAQIAEPNA
jgi:predicted ATPase/class 3 adenylate cyclase